MVSYTLNIVEGGGNDRQYFSDDNDQNRCHQIDYRALAETGEISDDLYYFRLCCLLENAAKCANTASVYGAFSNISNSQHRKRSLSLPQITK